MTLLNNTLSKHFICPNTVLTQWKIVAKLTDKKTQHQPQAPINIFWNTHIIHIVLG